MFKNMSKGYLIFLILMTVGYFYLASDKIDLLLNSETQDAKIVGCDSKHNSRAGLHIVQKTFLSFYPVAQTMGGVNIKGFPFIPKEADCLKLKGRYVSVFVHKIDIEKSAINTFFNFWILPYIGFYILLVFTVAGIKGSAPMWPNLFLVLGAVLLYLEF